MKRYVIDKLIALTITAGILDLLLGKSIAQAYGQNDTTNPDVNGLVGVLYAETLKKETKKNLLQYEKSAIIHIENH